jgi:hypothetical protein
MTDGAAASVRWREPRADVEGRAGAPGLEARRGEEPVQGGGEGAALALRKEGNGRGLNLA